MEAGGSFLEEGISKLGPEGPAGTTRGSAAGRISSGKGAKPAPGGRVCPKPLPLRDKGTRLWSGSGRYKTH